MPRIWTWLVLVACTTAMVVLVDAIGGPDHVAAQSGSSLTQPVPPTALDQRKGMRNILGLNKAKQRLAADMPTGRGIAVGQVEPVSGGGYMANTHDAKLPGTGFVPRSEGAGVSGHATAVARAAFGTGAPGQGVREVYAWQVRHWMGGGFLKTMSPDPPATDHGVRVFNHAWISSTGQADPLILRRVDHAIDTQDLVMVCGVNNQLGPIPPLLSQAYNVISVGTMSTPSSDGRTTLEGEGRCKPELVAPNGKTSFGAGQVTGCVAALLEEADKLVAADPAGPGKDAARSELVKALLMAGAWRQEAWAAPDGEPLDRALGAGVVDLDRALVMLHAGPVAPGTATRQRYGWSFSQIDTGKPRDYMFTVDAQQAEAGVALVWHRKILGGKATITNPQTGDSREVWNSAHFTPDLNLTLYRETDDGRLEPAAASTSKVDNVELLHLKPLEPGRYTLRISRADDDTALAWDYALAWRIEAQHVPR